MDLKKCVLRDMQVEKLGVHDEETAGVFGKAQDAGEDVEVALQKDENKIKKSDDCRLDIDLHRLQFSQ